jgi:hypothetical protein
VICDAVQVPKGSGSFEAREHWSGEQAEGYVKKPRANQLQIVFCRDISVTCARPEYARMCQVPKFTRFETSKEPLDY